MAEQRRPKGSGSLRPTGPNTYRLRVYLRRDPITGNPRQLERTYRGSKTGAAKALNDLIEEAGKGKHDAANATVSRLLDEWMDNRRRLGIRPTTLMTSESIVRAHLKPCLGHLHVGKVTSRDLDNYYATLQAKGLGDGTIRLHHNLLSGAFHQAVDWTWIDRNPAHRARPPASPRSSRRAPTTDEIRRLVEACGDDVDLATLVLLDAITGARRGELLGLQWRDMDWDAGILTMTRARVPAKGGDITGPLKSKKNDVRRVAIGARGILLLRTYRAVVEANAATLGVTVTEDGWLLSEDCGRTPLGTKAVTAQVTALGKKAGVPITLHELRHYAATQMVGGGVDVRTAAARLGHDPAVLLRTYSHVIPSLDRAAADMLELGVLGGTGER